MKNNAMKQCACGEWSGEPCAWVGPTGEMVVVEYMPHDIRASHDAAGNAGVYPCNGASRIRVSRDCAELMLEEDPDWTAKVSP